MHRSSVQHSEVEEEEVVLQIESTPRSVMFLWDCAMPTCQVNSMTPNASLHTPYKISEVIFLHAFFSGHAESTPGPDQEFLFRVSTWPSQATNL